MGEDMRSDELKSLSIDELTALYERIGHVLTEKIAAEKRRLEQRLASLTARSAGDGRTRAVGDGERRGRRPYPPVAPKYRNPANPAETWAGRGLRPRWVSALLKEGRRLEDLLIVSEKAAKRGRRRR